MYKVEKENYGKIEICGIYLSYDAAADALIEVISNTISNFEEYSLADIEIIKDSGREGFGSGEIRIVEIISKNTFDIVNLNIVKTKINLRSILGSLAADYAVEGISWYEEDNTGDIQIETYIVSSSIIDNISEIAETIDKDELEFALEFALFCENKCIAGLMTIYLEGELPRPQG